MTEPMPLHFVVHGTPRGKGRPRFNRASGRAYTPAETVSAEQRVMAEWIAAGRPTTDGPLELRVVAVFARPQSHRLADGTLSKTGRASRFPCKRPDLDNLVKLALDALNGQAFDDDAQVVSIDARKRWALAREREHIEIAIEALT